MRQERPTFRFACRGLNLCAPYDLMPEGHFPYLSNVRSIKEGMVSCRQSLSSPIANLGGVIHSARRLNDDVDSTYTRLLGVGSSIYAGQAAFASKDTGYSGSPLSMVPFRPDFSPRPYMYVGDKQRMRKFAYDGSNYLTGVFPPSASPICQLSPAGYSYSPLAYFESAAIWVPGGTAGAATNPARFNTTIATVLYDTGSVGWASVSLTASDKNLQAGAIAIFNGTKNYLIYSVFQPITTTTIASIIYDSGNTGPCCIVPVSGSDGMVQDALITINGEAVRILSVTKGQDGLPSFRCSTTINHVAGEAIAGTTSFRVFTDITLTAGMTVTGNCVQSTIATGTGTLTDTQSFALNVINNRPLQPDDYIHISILLDNPSNVVEGRVSFDVGDGSFAQNVYYKTFRASDLQPSATGSQTAIVTAQSTVQHGITSTSPFLQPGYNPGNSDIPLNSPFHPQGPEFPGYYNTGVQVPTDNTNISYQVVPGGSSWTELLFKVSDLTRIGSDQSKSLDNVGKIQIQLTVTASTLLLVDSLWIGGTFGPDVGFTGFTPVQYRYRYRSSVTGAKSNPSPSNRNPLSPHRERIGVTLTASADPQVDLIDVYRFGLGQDSWKLVGTYPNTNSTINDDFPTTTILVNEDLEFDNFPPFPVTDITHSGTCNVSGTSVSWASGDAFNTSWALGAEITINGIDYTLHGSPSTTHFLTLDQSAGSQTGVSFRLKEPTIMGQPMPVLWSYGGQQIGVFMFACGDTYNPGYLYWSKSNDPDSASDSNNLEVTSPSEPLLNGVEYDGRAFVFSSERCFAILPDLSGLNKFSTQVVFVGNSLYARYSLTPTPYGLCWIGRDGVYLWGGGTPQSLTDDVLYPLFPHGGAVDSTDAINGYYPADFSNPDNLRLFFAEDSLYLIYPDTQGNYQLLRFDFSHKGWYPITYPSPASIVYQEEGRGINSVLIGTRDDNLQSLQDTGIDNATDITCVVKTPALNQGDVRSTKYYMDGYIDTTTTVTVQVYFDTYTLKGPAAFTVTPAGSAISSLCGGPVDLHRNIGLQLTWTGRGDVISFQPNCLIEPQFGYNFQTAHSSNGFSRYSHEKKAWLAAINSSTITFTINVDGVDHSFTVPSANGAYQKYEIMMNPLKGRVWRYSASSSSPFVLDPDNTIIQVKEWGSDGEYLPLRPFQQSVNT